MAGGLKRQAARDGEVGRGSVAFTLTKPIQMDQLAQEFADDFHHPPGIVARGDLTQASEENPQTIWIMGDVETNELKKAVTRHKPAAPSTVERPSFLDKPEDEPFTDDEIQQALRWLLKRGSA